MSLKVAVCAIAAPLLLADARLVTFDAAGTVTGTSEVLLIGTPARAFANRSALRAAHRAEIETESGSVCIRGVLADDEDIDIAELSLEGEVHSLAIAPMPDLPLWRFRDVPGVGDVFDASLLARTSGRAVLTADGGVAALTVGGERRKAVAIMRALALKQHRILSIAAWNAAIRTQPAIERRYQDAIDLLIAGDSSGAGRMLEEITQTDEHYGHAWFQLGFIRGKAGETRRKIEAFEKAIAEQPDYADAYYSLTLAYLLAGKAADARRVYQKLLVIDPQMAERLKALVEAPHDQHTQPARSIRPIA